MNVSLLLTAAVLLVLSGCVNIDSQLQPINPLVRDVVQGRDCSPIILGFGVGTNTVERAMVMNLAPSGDISRTVATPILRIRSITLGEGTLLLFGRRCVTVTGEP